MVRNLFQEFYGLAYVVDLVDEQADFVASLYRDHYKLATQIPFLPAFLQLRICRLLFGDIRRFVSRKV